MMPDPGKSICATIACKLRASKATLFFCTQIENIKTDYIFSEGRRMCKNQS